MLKFLLDKVLENPELNNKEKLLSIIHDEYKIEYLRLQTN